MGRAGQASRLTVADGGTVSAPDFSVIGFSSAANQIVVTGTNSVWTGGDNLSVGEGGSRNLLVVSNAGFYGGGNVIVGELSSSTNNRVVVDGGTLRVTNATGTGFLDVRRGTNALNAGLIDVDRLLLTNTQGFFEFKGGTLVTRGAVISNGAPFVVGTFGIIPAIWAVRAGVLALGVIIGGVTVHVATAQRLLSARSASILPSGTCARA